jgi:hypothetical protein
MPRHVVGLVVVLAFVGAPSVSVSVRAQTTGIRARDKVAILAALSLASELLEATESQNLEHNSVGPRIDSLLARLDKALAG